jgi:photosystem II stability/assembly factor-like uncharacterized protein
MSNDVAALIGGNVRVFVQEDGVSPAAAYKYYGCLTLDGPNQDLGTPDPLYCPSPTQRNKWDIIDDIPKTPALGTTDFTQRADKFLNDVWWDLKNRGCAFNMQAVMGSCQRPDDFTKWDAKLAFIGTRLNNLGIGALNPLTGDDNASVDLTGTLSYREWEPIRPIKFSERADSTVVAEVLDGFYYDVAQCGECGTPSDGCSSVYLLTAASGGSPGLSSQLVYSLDKGRTWVTIDIATLGGLAGNRMVPMGTYIVVVSQATGAHYYSPITGGIPSSTWTKVTSGYVSTKGPRAIYAKSSNQAFIAGAGGYIYYLSGPTIAAAVLTDGSITTQDLNDIHGHGQTVVAVGGNNAVLWSANDGDTFSLVTGPVVGANLTAIWALSENVWIVGTGTGRLFYTLNAGTAWAEIGLPATPTVINDIHFENNLVGYISAEVGGVATVLRSTDSGNSWQNTAPHISALPTGVRVNFVYSCGMNRVLAGGRKTAGGDGLVAIAE